MTPSLQRRQLTVAALVLAAFLGATGWVLDQAFREAAEAAQYDRLQGYVYTVLAAAEVGPDGVGVPDGLPESRFSRPSSGLYALIVDAAGRRVWSSRSTLGVELPDPALLEPGAVRRTTLASAGPALFALGYGIAWEDARAGVQAFTVWVAEDRSLVAEQVSAFRRSLWGWLLAAAAALLAAQVAALRWSLAPLRRVAGDVAAIEAGRLEELPEQPPRELRGLVRNLNALIRGERTRTRRYRETLDNLAHSLKTPLAVLRTALDNGPGQDLTEARDQVSRIDRTVEYQLRRAAAGSGHDPATRVPLRPLLERLLRTLERAYRERNVRATVDCPEELAFAGDADDLMEMLGNLLDNAFKWCRREVTVRGRPLPDAALGRGRVQLEVLDDGPGIPPELAARVAERGFRADEQVTGQGIGLAVVNELVGAYDGRLQLLAAPSGGARIVLELPGRTSPPAQY